MAKPLQARGACLLLGEKDEEQDGRIQLVEEKRLRKSQVSEKDLVKTISEWEIVSQFNFIGTTASR